MEHHLSKLKNGIRVVTTPMKERESVSMGIWVNAGSRDESPRLNGISHFLEHLVFKGTGKRTANQIKEAVEGVGGSLNAFTGEEYTCFLAKVARKHFENVFEVLADMVISAKLDKTDIEKERTVILEEIKMTQDQPSQLVEEFLCEILWPGHALGRAIAGTAESVSGLTPEDIREYRDRFYGAAHITVAAAGAVTPKLVEKKAAQFLTTDRLKNNKKIDLFRDPRKTERLKLHVKATEQTHLSLAVHALERNHPNERALDLLSVILGGNMSSRLFNEVREERGLAYEIGSSERKFKETGAFVVSAGVDHKKSSEALQVILEELEKTTQALVTDDELKRAKEFYLGQLGLGLENTMNCMIWAGESIVSLGKVKEYTDIVKAVQKTTREDLKTVAKKFLQPSRFHLAVVGPQAENLSSSLRKIFS